MKKPKFSPSSQRKTTTTLVEEIRLLAEAQRQSVERMGRLEETMTSLAEAQKRTEEQVAALAEAQRRTEERVGRLEETMATLAEAQRRTEEQVAALAKAQHSTEETIQQLARTVGALSDNIGFGLEDVAHVVLPGYLQRHFGIQLFGDELERRFIITDRLAIEVDLYGKGQQNGEQVVVVGECKSRIRSSQVEEFARKVAQLRSELQDKLIPVMFGFWIHPSATEAAQRTGILLVASYQR